MKAKALAIIVLCMAAVAPYASADPARRIQNINVRAYRNMMHTLYPSPFAQHFGAVMGDFRTFVNSNVLTPDVLKALLKKYGIELASDGNATSGIQEAKKNPETNKDLAATAAKTVDILAMLKVDVPKEIPGTTGTNTPTLKDSKKDYSNYNKDVGP